MAKESHEAKVARVGKIIAGLKQAYPNAHCELNYSNPLELLIATILSAQCTDKRVNLVTATLFKKYRSATDYANADTQQLEREIQSTGFFRNKTKSIKTCCAAIVEKHGGQVPRTMEELVELGGVGRKTANVVLGNAFGLNEGITVDTHVTRLSGLLGLTRHTDAEKIEQDLMKVIPRDDWTLVSHLLIEHGRRVCIARRPQHDKCVLRDICPSASL